MSVVACVAAGEKQWEADIAGQAAAETAWKWSSCPHLLTDGSHVGHPCWVPSTQTLSFPGLSCWSITNSLLL